MGRLANQVKAQEWRKRLRRFDASDVTVAQFCSRERVTMSAFWYWRRKCADVGDFSVKSEATFATVDCQSTSSAVARCRSASRLAQCSRSPKTVPPSCGWR